MKKWQDELRRSIFSIRELEKHLKLITSERRAFEKQEGNFLFRITPQILNLISKSDPDCPIRKQYIPRSEELVVRADELCDPLSDKKYSPVSGIVHKYKDRCLLMPTFCCPAYCRFCFRRESVDRSEKIDLKEAFKYIRDHKELNEVILSGGDPLLLTDLVIKEILGKLSRIKHVKIIRFHTRVPVILSSRVTKQLISVLKKVPQQLVFVIHVNNAKEISSEFKEVVSKLKSVGAMVLSQSVLLRGINDNFESLKNLFCSLVEVGVKPYYLHQLDKARGTSHFRVEIKKGKQLMIRLRKEISGVGLPAYVVDSGGKLGKIPLC
jgi:lysine 2,3-aminomutase